MHSQHIVSSSGHTVYMRDFDKNEIGRDGPHPRPDPAYAGELTAENLQRVFAHCADFELRQVTPALAAPTTVAVCWLDGVVSGTAVSEEVLRPLTEPRRMLGLADGEALLSALLRGGIYSYSVKRRDTLSDVAADLIQGFCAVVVPGAGAVTFETRSSNTRAIGEPSMEKTVKGAKDAFVETLRINTSLVRRKLRTPSLKVEQTLVGRKSNTTAAVLYVEQVADQAVVEELLARINAIDIDGLLAAGDLEEYIVDDPNTPFPQMLHTERADKFAMLLLEGRVGVIVDGLPLGFLLPATLSAFLQVPDDSAQHYTVATALTLLRWMSLVFALVLPALLVAVAMYHQEMLPTKLLQSMVAAKQQVPFGVAMEVLAMLVAFELLQEAGLRLPSSVGQTVSIIGALIVGQSAVEARVVSPIAVIVVALSGISGYAMPSQDLSSALRLLRLALVLCSMLAGLFGLMAGLTLLIWHLTTLESFGVAYTAPVTDSDQGFASVLLRRPLRRKKFRPGELGSRDRRRQR